MVWLFVCEEYIWVLGSIVIKKFIFVYKNQICDILYRYIFGENYLITDYISTILLLLDLKGNFLLR